MERLPKRTAYIIHTIYTHICMRAYIYTCLHSHIYTYTLYAYIQYMHVSMHDMHTYILAFTFIHTHIYACKHNLIYTYACIHKCTHITHACIHTYTL